MTKISRSHLLELLTVGKQLNLIHSLLGPCNKPREILSTSKTQIVMKAMDREDKAPSYLKFNTGDEIYLTGVGFVILNDGEKMVEYEFVS